MNYEIKGNLLDWVRDYLSERKQYTVVNGELSDQAYVTSGVIKLRVGTNTFRPVHVYADDTTIYSIGESVDSASKMLNNALKELEDRSSTNHLVPHPKKCEAMMLLRGSFTGLLNAVQPHNKMGNPRTIVSGLLGVTIDNKLAWSQHVFEVKKSFVNKLNLLKRSSFLPPNILVDLYFEIILPSVSYALPIWGSFMNKDGFLALESLHCKAAKLIYGLTRDMPTVR